MNKNLSLANSGDNYPDGSSYGSVICCLATANDKNTVPSTKFEKCCYFGETCSEKHVFNFSKELILLFMEDFWLK